MSDRNPGVPQLEDCSVDEHKGLECLPENLNTISNNMVAFSMSMRALYNEQNVSALNEKTTEFREVRDNTRRNAVVYTECVLPLCEELVRSIGIFTDFFEYLEFDDWKDCIDDQIIELDQCIEKCKLMRKMHGEIIESLKKDEDKAEVGIKKLELHMKTCIEQAEGNEQRELILKGLGLGLFIAGAGIIALGVAAPFAAAASEVFNATVVAYDAIGLTTIAVQKGNSYQATANKENAEIDRKAINVTKKILVPAMKTFLEGVEAIQGFFTDKREELMKMQSHAVKCKKKPFFLMFKAIASETNASCKKFQRMAQMMKNDMASIPAESGDKNYVDLWLEEMLKSDTIVDDESMPVLNFD